MMEKINVTTSILSISSPGVHLVLGDDDLAIDLARKCNEFATDLKKKHATSHKFGVFAVMPLPAVDAAIAEVEQAYNDGADGIKLSTNYHGIYLGDPRFDPFMAELDKRRAIVFVHPTTGCISTDSPQDSGTSQILKVNPIRQTVPAPVLEFFADTARALTNLTLKGALTRYPHITWIFSHLGGALPPLLSRFTGFSQAVPLPDITAMSESDFIKLLNERVYFDMAGWAFPRQWKMLVDGAEVGFDRLVYGTDFPFTNAGFVQRLASQADEYTQQNDTWTEERIEGAWFANAQKLFKLP